MTEPAFRTLSGTVESLEPGHVVARFEHGGMLKLPESAVHGKATPGSPIRLVAFIPGSVENEGEAMSRAILNELLSPTNTA